MFSLVKRKEGTEFFLKLASENKRENSAHVSGDNAKTSRLEKSQAFETHEIKKKTVSRKTFDTQQQKLENHFCDQNDHNYNLSKYSCIFRR